MTATLKSELLAQIQKGFPADFLTRDPAELQTYGRDWTKVFPPDPCAIAFPRSTEEVARLLKLCSEHSTAVVPSGGRTGLSAGAVAAKGELVLSLARMNKIGDVDPLAQTVRVQAGAVTEAVHQKCAEHELTWPVDFASKGSSHVGGNISTNAGGVRVIHYGMTRNWVLGLQVVTMAGDVLELNGALEKNNTGLDLRQLFIGSEGTLGVVTEAILKLARLPREPRIFFFALKDIPAVLKLFLEARRSPFTVMAFECLTRNCLETVVAARGLKDPFAAPAGAYALLEIDRPEAPDADAQLDEWLASLFEKGLVEDGTLAQSPAAGKALWSIREGVSESLMNKGFVHKNDISLPISALEAFTAELYSVFRERHRDFEIYFFGHIGDGNLHLNTMKPESMAREEFLRRCHDADRDLFGLVRKYRGSVSAEHGIGLLKKEALHYTRAPAEIEIFRGMKKLLDPAGLLNPGKIFD